MMIRRMLFRLLSLSPICSITRDDNYGYNKLGIEKGLRFSLINLMLGHTTYYFLTFRCVDKKVKFKFKERLSLAECQWCSDKEGEGGPVADKDKYIKELSQKYISTYTAANKEDIEAQKEFLLYLQNSNSNRKNLSYEKMNYYTTVGLVFLPLIPAFFNITFSSSVNNVLPLSVLYWVLFITLVYMLVNWGCLAIQYMSVSGISKSPFAEIKNPPENRSSQQQLLYSYYFDWQEERFDTNLRVAYVCATEVFVKAAILLIIALMVLPYIARKIDQVPQIGKINESYYIYTINTSQLENPFTEDSIALSELHTQIRKRHPSAILVFTSFNTETENLINQSLQPYSGYINIIKYTDETLKINTYKFALLD